MFLFYFNNNELNSSCIDLNYKPSNILNINLPSMESKSEPFNDKIMTMTTFQHKEIDAYYQKEWVKQMQQHDVLDVQKQCYNMILAPPNITSLHGLHLGHVLHLTIQDIIARYHKLKGDHVTWIPGVDHAGIATQVVVEKQLMKDTGQTRHDLGREKFLEKVWEWKEANCKTISKQIQTMCPMINHELEQFTMSPELSKAVTNAFVKLYESNLIFRDLRMIDYCCYLKTVISNIEVDEIEIDKTKPMIYTTPNGVKVELGLMYEIKYEIHIPSLTDKQKSMIEQKNMDSIIVSTTRPETMFGDVAVAVNPLDDRFKGLENIKLRIPFTNKLIPLIYDTLAKIDIGTGAVKITPYHDPKDWECYLRCKDKYLFDTPIEIIDDDGKMVVSNDVLSIDDLPINGKDRYICRKNLLKRLHDESYLIGTKKHKTKVRVCSRSRDILEPKLKYQWYVNTDEMSKRSIDAVESGELKIIPDPDGIHSATWKRFLSEGRSWCISRQLFWGHRIPAYRLILTNEINNLLKFNNDDEWIIAESLEQAIEQVTRKYPYLYLEYNTHYILKQDEDVLDTWFSSGIYPFTILDGEYFPLDILETGKDILFFWVARMVMLSLALKNILPFKTVYLHNIVRDKEGRKMSKSSGNVIDPLDIIYGITRQDMEERIKNSNLDGKEITKALQNIKKNFPNGISDYGVDSLRMGMVYYLKQSTDINLDPTIFKSAHSMLNKLWNVMLMYELYAGKLTRSLTQKLCLSILSDTKLVESDNYKNDYKIFKELFNYINVLEQKYLDWSMYENNDFTILYDNIQQYIMNNYCPFYLEFIKYVLLNDTYRDTELGRDVLLHMLKTFISILVFLHPIAPNATSAMIQRLVYIDVWNFKPIIPNVAAKICSVDGNICSFKMHHEDILNNTNKETNHISRFESISQTFEMIRSTVHNIKTKKDTTKSNVIDDTLIDERLNDYRKVILFLVR